VWFEASRDIEAGEELLYNYGTGYWDPITPLNRRLEAVLRERGADDSPLYKLNARLNPRRVLIDYF